MTLTKLCLIFVNLIFLWLKIVSVEGIVGGKSINIGQPLYTVSLQVDDTHLCSGAIISNLHLITAASCVLDEHGLFKNEKYKAVIGVTDLNTNSHKIIVNVEKLFVPKEFKHIDPLPGCTKIIDSANIAILKLDESIALEDRPFLSKLELPKTSRNYIHYDNQKVNVAGFGIQHLKTRNVEETINICKDCTKLNYLEAIVIPRHKCNSMLVAPIQGKHICAGAIKHDAEELPAGVCKGDIGSPLVLNNEILIGVLIKTSPRCDETSIPAVYTRIRSFIPVIFEILRTVEDFNIPESVRMALYQRKPDGSEELTEFYKFI